MSLVADRNYHYECVFNAVAKEYQVSIINELNSKQQYEQQFDSLEEQLRGLDPEHILLAENQLTTDWYENQASN